MLLTKELLWQQQLEEELAIFLTDEPAVVFEDNTASISLSEAGTHHRQSKHFGIEWHFTRDIINAGLVEMRYCCTEFQLADILTKALPPNIFTRLRTAIMLGDGLQRRTDVCKLIQLRKQEPVLLV